MGYTISMPIDLFLNLLTPKPVYANCPVCIVTVGGGLFIAQRLGIDDLLITLWISGLNTALAFFMADKIKKPAILKNGYFWSILFYLTTVFYFFTTSQAGLGNNLWGIDKSLFGLSLGVIIFFLSIFIDKFLRLKNNGKVLFFYQKVIIPVSLLLITTLIFNQFI